MSAYKYAPPAPLSPRGSKQLDWSDDDEDDDDTERQRIARRRSCQFYKLLCCGFLIAALVVGLLLLLSLLLARALAGSSSVQALDDKINHWETRIRRRQTALAPPSTAVMPAPTDAMVLITGELRFRDAEAADALKKRLSNVTVTIVCTWRRFASVAERLTRRDDTLLVDEAEKDKLPQHIPHGASVQFYLLQRAVRFFKPWLLSASVVLKLRTDAHFADDFSLPRRFPDGNLVDDLVLMETDLAFAASPQTFVRVYENTYDAMVIRKYYNHREEGRPLMPNFNHVARSDASNADKRGYRTRWRWLDYPTAVYTPKRDFTPSDIVQLAAERLPELDILRFTKNVSTRRLTTIPPVPRFCAESAFLHHTLEHAAVGVLGGVTLLPREKRCPDGNRRRGGLRECTGWLT